MVTELPYANGEDSFRPDITFLVNGMPLGFMEVKRENNKDGILAEHDRMHVRFKNEAYRPAFRPNLFWRGITIKLLQFSIS